MLKGIATACSFVGITSLVSAQTNDHVFRSWRWSEDSLAPRATGMAGAFVAVADDASAAFINPAGLTLLAKSEVMGGLASYGSGTLPLGDVLQARTGLGFVGGGGRVSARWAVGGFLTKSHDRRISLASDSPPGAGNTGYLETTVTNVGGAVSWQPTDRLSLGMRVNVTHLRVQASETHETMAGPDLLVGMGSGKDRITEDLGVILRIGENVRIGTTFRQGASWAVERTAINPLLGSTLDTRPFELRSPSSFSGGLAVQKGRILLSGQADYVLYGQIRGSLSSRYLGFDPAHYQLDDALEARLGLEGSCRAGPISLQLRAGIYSQAPGSFAYRGVDDLEAASFVGSARRTVGTAGVSIVSRTLRLDAAAIFGGERTLLTAGAAVRF